MSKFDGRRILITGGTGSFGQAMVKRLLEYPTIERVIVFSRDELKQYEMQGKFQSSKLQFFLGDVRDKERLVQATRGVDVIIHAAAMKQIPAAEYNPMEAIKTNVLGAENIMNVALVNNVEKVIALSTDKAANPANLYGATKLCSDKLLIAGNTLAGNTKTRFSIVRYGNVLGSRGSVVPFFLQEKDKGFIPITDIRMTRFWITLPRGVEFVVESLGRMVGGEIFVPKIKSFKVVDVANIVAPGVPHKVIGIRQGEKLHEMMITSDDSLHTFEYEDYYSILRSDDLSKTTKEGKRVMEGFSYSSDTNPEWYQPDEFLALLKANEIIA